MNFLALSSLMSVWTFKGISIIEALQISYSGSNEKDSTTYKIKCEITGFSSLASWTRNGTIMVQCQSSGCLHSGDQRYIFGYDSGAIYADFMTLATNEEGVTWTCEHDTDSPASFTVDVSFRLSMRAIGNNKVDSTTYCLECKIPGFSNQSVWKKGGNQLSTCNNTGCSTVSIQVYSFRHDASATYVDFHTLKASEDDIQWTCEHTGDVTAHFEVQLDFEDILIIAGSSSMGISIIVMDIAAVLFQPECLLFSCLFAILVYNSIKHDVFRGKLRNSLRVFIVAAVVQFVAILSALILLTVYKDKHEDYEIITILILLLVCPVLGVWIYRICDRFCCRKARKDHEISSGKQTRASYRNDQLKITDESNSLELIRITEARVGSQDKSDWNQLDVSYTKDQLKTTEEGRSTAETDTPKIKENIETCLLVTVISAFAWVILLPLLVWFCFKVIKEKVSKGNGCDNTLKNDIKVAEMDTTKQTKSSTQRKSKNGNKIEQKKQEDTGSTNPSESPNEAAT